MLTLEMQKALYLRGYDAGRWMIDKRLEAPQFYNATCGMPFEKWRDTVYIPREYSIVVRRPTQSIEGVVFNGNDENVLRE